MLEDAWGINIIMNTALVIENLRQMQDTIRDSPGIFKYWPNDKGTPFYFRR